MYPRTLFTFNSVILTSCTKTNEFVHDLNEYVYSALRTISNGRFFNSHSVMCEFNRIHPVYIDRNGIHISYEAVSYITNQLVNYVKKHAAHHVSIK